MVTGGEGCRYPANGTVHAFVLPDAQRQPTQEQEMCIGLLVSEGVALGLLAASQGELRRRVSTALGHHHLPRIGVSRCWHADATLLDPHLQTTAERSIGSPAVVRRHRWSVVKRLV